MTRGLGDFTLVLALGTDAYYSPYLFIDIYYIILFFGLPS